MRDRGPFTVDEKGADAIDLEVTDLLRRIMAFAETMPHDKAATKGGSVANRNAVSFLVQSLFNACLRLGIEPFDMLDGIAYGIAARMALVSPDVAQATLDILVTQLVGNYQRVSTSLQPSEKPDA